jgi:hypothetical protein
MAATIQIRRWTGTGAGTGTDITETTTRASTSDVASPGTANPLVIPLSGTNYSFWVSLRLYASTAPTGTIDTLKWYSDGTNSFGTGYTAKVADASTGLNSGYRQATGTVGTTGTLLNTTNHTGLDAAPADFFSKTLASPLTLGGSTTGTGDFGDFVVFQIEIASTAASGTLTSELFTFKYDET